ncbi:MAG: PLP-dependent aminotransferase family protein [Steroidobacteraceae bacterium]
MFSVVRKSPVPLGDQLVERVTELILSGRLPEGSRLPSVRQLARRVGVSVYTVTSAFERLSSKGLIDARAGAGYFVASNRTRTLTSQLEVGLTMSSDPILGFTRQAIEQINFSVPAGSGFLPGAWLSGAVPSSILSRAARNGALLQSAAVQGDPGLRELLAERIRMMGLPVAARSIIVTFGASHAFDLIARTLLRVNEGVLVDDPGYFVLHAQLRAHGAHLIPVPRVADGADLDALEAAARLHRPRMFVTQTVLHNPTGTSATAANCHGILTLAEKYNFVVVEDHVYTDLAPRRAVSLAQIDELKRVLYVGSFTKVLGPGMRIGFIAAPEALVSPLVDSKILGVLSGSALDEFVLREMLDSGKYRKHTERLRDRLGTARAVSTTALRRAGMSIEPADADGIFLWCRLPSGVDTERLYVDARAAGILLAPGSMFSISGQGGSHLRINVAYGNEPALCQFLASNCAAAA